MLFQCWASAVGGGPILKQHWVSSHQTGQAIACIRTAVKAYTSRAEPVLVESWPNVADVQHTISPGCQPADIHETGIRKTFTAHTKRSPNVDSFSVISAQPYIDI